MPRYLLLSAALSTIGCGSSSPAEAPPVTADSGVARDGSQAQDAPALLVDGGLTQDTGGGSCGSGCVSTAFHQGTEGLIVIEAEHPLSQQDPGSDRWNPVSIAGADGQAMRAEPDDGDNFQTGYAGASPRLEFSVDFAQSGTHTAWIRIYTDDVRSSESLFLDMDDPASTDAVVYAATMQGTWEWRSAPIEVPSTGVHTLYVWMREDGVAFDKILIAADSSYAPHGTDAPESGRSCVCDVPSSCGDGTCDTTENCASCPSDCGCVGGTCDTTGTCQIDGDDTFACLEDLNGPVMTIAGIQDYGNYDYFGLADGQRIEARTATWMLQTDPALPDGSINTYPIDMRTSTPNTVCFAGGTVHGTNDLDIAWTDSKHPNNAAIMAANGYFIIDGVRVFNGHDGFRPRADGGELRYWELRNSWFTWLRDDCIENDHFRPGLVEDTLFDGCYVFLSSRVPNASPWSGQVVTVRDSLVRMEQMPEPYGHAGETITGTGPLFKYQSESPHLVLENNIFLFEGLASTRSGPGSWINSSPGLMGFPAGKVDSCSNNTIVWLGDGPFPGNVPEDPSCVTITTDKSVWDDARDAWIASHPAVPRLSGLDPMTVNLGPDAFTPRIVSLSP